MPVGEASLDEVLRQALTLVGTRVSETGTAVTHDALPTVQGDITQLSLVFQNLLSNALKYRKPAEPPRIHISAKRQESEWLISIRDNGIGFAPSQAERIFGLFKRLHSEAEYPGTGLGLAICKRIIERYGGTIWAESEPGAGSTFLFSLPGAAFVKDLLQVLLFEDNQGDVLLVQEALREHQVEHRLHVINDGLQAERHINRIGQADDAPRPDVLLIDLNLPHRDGHELLQLFRNHPLCRATPVMVITSSGAEKDRRRAAELGATRYFQKPSDVDEFIRLGAVVLEVVGRKVQEVWWQKSD